MNRKSGPNVKGETGGTGRRGSKAGETNMTCAGNSAPARRAFLACPARLAFQACRARGVA